jgi:arylsulfatase
MALSSVTPPPNILVIMSDQHRGDALGIERHPVVLTPNLDHLAASGARFRRAYSTCPMCIPSRRSFMTGQFPSTHGMFCNVEGQEWNPAATLPGEFRKAGYHTALVGREMHLHPRRKRYGFDHMVLSGNLHADDVYEPLPGHGHNPHWGHGLGANSWTARPWHLDESLHPAHRTVDDALQFLERRDPSCPFFLVASFMGPHPPLYPPAFYMDRYLRQPMPPPVIGDWARRPVNDGRGLDPGGPICCLEGEALRSAQAGYYGLINYIDDQINRLLNPLIAFDRETAANTIVVYLSDHGEMLGDHHMFAKSRPYEGAARVPLLIRAPARFGLQPGLTVDRPVCLEDVMPTLLEMAGLPVPPSVDGASLMPLLRAPDAPWRPFLHGEFASRGDWGHQSLTDERWKYVWLSQDGRELLFDLKADPGETTNLATRSEHRAELERWRQRLMQHLAGRPEGFTDGRTLIAGRPFPALRAPAPRSLAS